MSRSEYRKFRCVSFLEAVKTNDLKKFEKSLRSNKKAFEAGTIRTDTLLKTAIGHTAKNHDKVGSFPKLFIDEALRNNEELSLSLNEQQLYKAIQLNPDPKELYRILEGRVLKKPFASSRAVFLKMLRNKNKDLVALGISLKTQEASINKIEKESADSEILCHICIPVVRGQYK